MTLIAKELDNEYVNQHHSYCLKHLPSVIHIITGSIGTTAKRSLHDIVEYLMR
jgi:hypothetical protein